MTPDQRLWARTRDDLVRVIESLGFPAELGEAAARLLGSPKAMERMISYLRQVQPQKEELRSTPGGKRRPVKKRMPVIMRSSTAGSGPMKTTDRTGRLRRIARKTAREQIIRPDLPGNTRKEHV